MKVSDILLDKNNESERFMGVAHDMIRNQIYYDNKRNLEIIFYLNEYFRSEEEVF